MHLHPLRRLTRRTALSAALAVPVLCGSVISSTILANPLTLKPEGFEKHLLGERSRTSQHIINESTHALTLGGVILGSFILQKVMPSSVPLGLILNGAGVAMDLSLAPTWTDFTAHQLVRAPIALYNHVWAGKRPTPAWLDSIVMETPTLLRGAWEFWLQNSKTLPEGLRVANTSPEYQLTFSNKQEKSLILGFNKSNSSQETNGKGTDTPLSHLADTARQHGVTKVQLTLLKDGVTPNLKVCIYKKEGDSYCPTLALAHSGSGNMPWITDALAGYPKENSTGQVLSPLSSCTIERIQKTILDGSSVEVIPPLVCTDMVATVINGKHMQAIDMGQSGYLLADHTETQGTELPELWLDTKPASVSNTALAQLEAQRLPGTEKGVWRLLAAVRGAFYHNLIDFGVNKAMKLSKANGNKSRYNESEIPASRTSSHIKHSSEDKLATPEPSPQAPTEEMFTGAESAQNTTEIPIVSVITADAEVNKKS